MITVYKSDHTGREVIHYRGTVLERTATLIRLEARFEPPDRDAGYVLFRHGDRFVEWFYTDRWYSIFEIHDREDDHLKGWYCNISRPAIFGPDTIRADDLALDAWIDPAGRMLLLDEDDFATLPLDATTRQAARAAVDELAGRLTRRDPPFAAIPR
ncbi:MAG TPA: DUF402 domain-containing protein [Aggregatilineales bacterium]|nr:DUF402 domain-containing protein [Aggregatilineales bacterium]